MNDRTKKGPTPKQNKYKNPGHFWRVFYHLRKGGMDQGSALVLLRRRRKLDGDTMNEAISAVSG